jgi:hypothetical protein
LELIQQKNQRDKSILSAMNGHVPVLVILIANFIPDPLKTGSFSRPA